MSDSQHKKIATQIRTALERDATETVHDLKIVNEKIKKQADIHPILWACIGGVLFAFVFIGCLLFQSMHVRTMADPVPPSQRYVASKDWQW